MVSILSLGLFFAACSFSQAADTAVPTCPAVTRCLAALSSGAACPLLPLPPGTEYPPIPPQGFNLTLLRPHVYSYADGLYQTLIFHKGPRLAMVDFPTSGFSVAPDGSYLLIAALRQVLRDAKPTRFDMVYTHRHADHIGNAALVRKYARETYPGINILIWGTNETRNTIIARNMSTAPIPNILVGAHGRTVNMAPDLNLQLRVIGGHTQTDLAVLVPATREGAGLVHFVDVLTPRAVPFLRFGVTMDLRKYLIAHRDLLELPWTVLSPGHGFIGDRSDVMRNIAYTEFLIAAAGEAVQELGDERTAFLFGRWRDVEAREYRNTQWVFGTLEREWAELCAQKVVRRWGCVLAGADVFAMSHCETALLFLSIDA